jgi:hypothetical protein
MSKKISHPYPHVGVTLSPHADRARPYPLLLSLDLSLSLSRRSTRMWFSKASVEHEVSVALDGVAEGWVTVERKVALELKVALPPPPRRGAHGIRLLHQGGDLLLCRGCLISSPPSWPISSPSPSTQAPPSGPPSSATSSCSSKLPSARAPSSLSPTTHLRPRLVREVLRAMAR